MNNKELRLAAKLLEQLGDILSNRRCNDFNFPGYWSDEEMTNFVKEYHTSNGDLEEYEYGCTKVSDFCVAGLLAEKIVGMVIERGDNDGVV